MKPAQDESSESVKSSDEFEVPEGWRSVILKDHIYIAARIGWRGLKREEYTKEGPLFLAVKDIREDGTIDYQNVTDHLSEYRYDESPEIQLKDQDIIITKDGTIGKIGFVKDLPGKVTVNSSLLVVRPSPEILPRFLFFYFRSPSFQKIVRERITGSAVPHLFQKDIKKFRILVPPLAEQQRIVARVETLLVHVNEARGRLGRVPAIMKKFRQGVLAAACSGRLTEGWREENPDVEPAIEFLQKIKPDVRGKKNSGKHNPNDFFEFDQFDLPNLWTWTTTSEICIEISDGDHYPPPKIPSGVPFIVISNISSGKMDFTKTMFAAQKYYDELEIYRKPQYGDVLYTVTGSYGIPVIVDTHREFCFQRHIALFRPHSVIPSKFLWILLKSDIIYRQSTSIATGIAQLTVPLAGLRALKIPLPPLAEQQEIVRRVNALFARADAIEREVAAATKRTEATTQAVLGKAFRGELIQHEAEAIKSR